MGRPKKVKKIVVESVSEHIEEECKNPEFKKALEKENKKLDALRKLLNEKNRDSKEVLLKFASDEAVTERISFGLKALDLITGGGIPHKRFSILWGSKGVGKTTLAYKAIAEAQKQNKVCAFIDLERSFDNERAAQFGVQLDKLVLANSFTNAEQAMDMLISLCKEKVVDFVVLDSIQALSPKGEQETKKGKEKSVEEDTMALLARKLSQFFRMSSGSVFKGNIAILLIGQARMSLGGFVALESLSGGHALMHWSTLTLRMTRGAKSESPSEKVELDDEDEKGKKIKVDRIVGFQSIIKLDKTKISGCAIEGTEIRLPYYFKEGFKEE